MNSEQNLFILSVKDFMSVQMLKYALLPFIISMVIIYTLFFLLAGAGLDALGSLDVQSTQTTIQNGIPHTESIKAHLEGSAIIKFLMSHAITSWIATFLVYAIGGFFTLYVSIIVAIIVIGFLTPFVLKELHLRHYQDVEMIGYSNIFQDLFLILKWAFIMLLLFFLFIPLYFIPIVNILAFNFPLYYFFHKVMTFDVASSICTKDEDYLMKYKFGTGLRLKTLALYLISLVPFAIFFGAIFFVIYLGNTYFTGIRQIRAQKNV